MSGTSLRTELARDGIFNTRDLGGLVTSEGMIVRPGRVYRADSLQRVKQSAPVFRSAGVTRVLDLREDAERERAGVLELDGIEVIHHPVLDPTFGWTSEDALAPGELLPILYREILETFGDRFTTALAEIAQVVDSGPAAAVAFHCSLGKDRTGLLSAILLSLLGVEQDQIVADYVRSGNATAVQLQWLWSFGIIRDEVTDDDLTDGLWSAKPATLHSTLEFVQTRYGGFRNYAIDHGLDPEVIDVLRGDLLIKGDEHADKG